MTRAWLQSQWRAAVGTSSDASDEAFGDIVRRYSEPHRHYHTLDHVFAVAALVEEWGVVAAEAAAVTLAAILHDVIYDARAKHNEELSAAYATDVLSSLHVPAATIEEVARLIALTATHSVADDDANAAVLCDADLSILGAPRDVYDRYVENVRAEYHFVPDDAWRSGRAAVLDVFLQRRRLFITDTAHGRFDAAARRNLARELAALR